MIKIFVLASGRSGTKYLSGLFKHNIKNCVSKHEPQPDMFGKPILWYQQGKIEKIRRSFIRKKKRIDGYTKDVYIETNHAFLKSSSDVAMEFFSDMKLIHLIRNPLKVARSELNRHIWIDQIHMKLLYPFSYYKDDNGKKYFRWALTGKENIFQTVDINTLTSYQKYVVQWIEIENRAMKFLETYKKHNDYYTLSVPKDLNDYPVLNDLFNFFQLKQKEKNIIMRGKRNKNKIPTIVSDEDKKQFHEVVNNLPDKYLRIFQKKPYTRFEWVNLLTKSGTDSK